MLPPKGPDAIFNDLHYKRPLVNFSEDPEVKSSKVDLKVKELALDRILTRHIKKIYGKLVATTGKKVIDNLFIELFGRPEKESYINEKKLISLPKNLKSQAALNFNIPIGIMGYNSNNWINALIQFIIHIPSLRNMFDFTPKSFYPFNLFIDCYEKDKSESRAVTSANSEILIECLYRKFNEKFFLKNRGRLDLYKILALIMGVFHSESLFDSAYMEEQQSQLLALHPDWQIICDIKNSTFTIEQHISNSLSRFNSVPKELLIAYKWLSNNNGKIFSKARKQLVLFKNGFIPIYYELDSFIEYRFDGWNGGSYITYLKIEGNWYQCDDIRVKAIRSNNLQVALNRAILFHYKSIAISQNRII